ncbi:transposable element Tcb2 transposase [Trichonephila clavipes]|nr:transposable element Tcb2 transposase [Trichonephila clavipes]
MDWPAYFPDLNPSNTCGMLWGDVLQHAYIIRRIPNKSNMLIDEWALLPQEMLHQLVLSMRRWCEATIAVRGGHIPY